MFSSPVSFLFLTVLLSLAVVLIAGLSEGRLRHVLRIVFGLERNRGADHVWDEVERPASDWSVLNDVHAEPDEVPGSERAKQWAQGTLIQAKGVTRGVVDVGRDQITKVVKHEPAPDSSEFPTTGEIAISRR